MTTQTEQMRRDAEIGAVAEANRQGMIDVIVAYGLYVTASDLPNWRPTLRVSGEIPGVAASVTILATDGVVGYFVFDGSEREGEVLFGHVQRFSGKVKPLFSVRPATPKRPRKAKPSAVEQMRELLKQLTSKDEISKHR